jgi:predicted DNA repair protein MutK
MPSLLTTISALADDMASIALKVGATSLDDVASQAAKTIPKTAGILIDDTAVIPQFIDGAASKRELPIILKIALGSIRNKLLMIPLIILASTFMPWIIGPIMLCGAAFLAFEGVEGLGEKLGFIKPHHEVNTPILKKSESKMISDAIKTDTILSLEVLVITISQVVHSSILEQSLVLVVVSVLATMFVYGIVAAIVRMDDIGFYLKAKYKVEGFLHKLGDILVTGMPIVMNSLSWIGGIAMLTVAGGIIVHYFHDLEHLGIFIISPVHDALASIPLILPTLSFLAPTIPAIILGVAIFNGLKLYKKIF